MFTDEVAGLRFDETHLTVSRAVEVGAWILRPEIGAVRAGEIGVRYRQRVAAVFSYNAFGTEDDHLHIRFGWRVK
jgi:hypothetical protein